MRRILLVRHGQSQGNVDDLKYKDPGDPLVELTDEGWQQAYDAGKFLRWYYRQYPPDTDKEPFKAPVIWSSTYMRARQTTQAVLKGLGWEDRAVREDLRLVEQSYGSAPWSLEDDNLKAELQRSQDVYKKSRFLTPLPHGESLMNQFDRVSDFIGSLHRADRKRGEADVLIVSHGGTMKNFLMRWFHIPDYQTNQLDTPHNCDVIALEHDGEKWHVRKIYDGEARYIALGKNPHDSFMGNPFANLKPLEIPGPRKHLI